MEGAWSSAEADIMSKRVLTIMAHDSTKTIEHSWRLEY